MRGGIDVYLVLQGAWLMAHDMEVGLSAEQFAAFEGRARRLVGRWEHGDAVHRQWLRDMVIPDLIAEQVAVWNAAVEMVHALVTEAAGGSGSIWDVAAMAEEAIAPGRGDINGGIVLDHLPNAIWALRNGGE